MPSRLQVVGFFGCVIVLGSAALVAAGAARAQTAKPAQTKKPPVTPAAPPAPVSKHYPILLIASGSEQGWSARIGMKGVERLERTGYPPITLEPGEISAEESGTAWTYKAKDTGTDAAVTLRLTREACAEGTPETKYSFRAVLTHAQIGELKGCAKSAAEQFPEFKQKNLDDDDPDKKKVVPPAITGFKNPVVTAYLAATGKVMIARGESAKVVAPAGSQLSFSHDGKKLLFTRNDAGKDRTIVLYDVASGKLTELVRGTVASAFFSPNDSTIAFMKLLGADWQVWTMPVGSPEKAAVLGAGPVWALHGWIDGQTVLASDAAKLYFLRTDSPATSIPVSEVYGQFERNSTDTIRVHPLNADLLLVTALTQAVKPGMARDADSKLGGAAFLYEIKSKRQVVVTPPNALAQGAEWSRDGLQIFFTDAANRKAPSICKIFWDGSGFKRVRAGSGLVVGQ